MYWEGAAVQTRVTDKREGAGKTFHKNRRKAIERSGRHQANRTRAEVKIWKSLTSAAIMEHFTIFYKFLKRPPAARDRCVWKVFYQRLQWLRENSPHFRQSRRTPHICSFFSQLGLGIRIAKYTRYSRQDTSKFISHPSERFSIDLTIIRYDWVSATVAKALTTPIFQSTLSSKQCLPADTI